LCEIISASKIEGLKDGKRLIIYIWSIRTLNPSFNPNCDVKNSLEILPGEIISIEVATAASHFQSRISIGYLSKLMLPPSQVHRTYSNQRSRSSQTHAALQAWVIRPSSIRDLVLFLPQHDVNGCHLPRKKDGRYVVSPEKRNRKFAYAMAGYGGWLGLRTASCPQHIRAE
jgi:hypothetical protein